MAIDLSRHLPRRLSGAFHLALPAAFAPTVALANVPMFWLIGYAKFGAWWAIPVALAIEAYAIRRLFDATWKRAWLVSIVVNAASALLGVFLYIAVATATFSIFAPLFDRLAQASVDAFAFELAGMILATVLVDVAIETFLLGGAFAYRIRAREFFGFAFANVISTLVIYSALFLS